MNDIKACVLGGDQRQISVANTLKNYGYHVSVFGLNSSVNKTKNSKTLREALENSSVIVLPLPFSADGIRVLCPLDSVDIKLSDIISSLKPNQIVAGGRLTPNFISCVKAKNATVFDYCSIEKFSILNAIPTAEGALAIAINETKSTIFGSKCAVVGYGRIAKILSRLLKCAGADVTVFARNEDALTWAYADGFNALNITELEYKISDKNLIFNTVPHTVITKNVLDKTLRDVTIIDLASTPGGVDFEYAKKTGIKVIFALSLPGKIAPESAGKTIADCIVSNIKGVIL